MKSDECLNFVTEILTVLKSTNQCEKSFSLIVDRIVRLFGCQSCAIIIVDPATEYLHIAASHGISWTFSKEFRRKLAAGAVGRLLWTGEPVLIEDSHERPALAEEMRLEHAFRSCLCVQLSVDHRTLGYLHADSTRPGAFTAQDIRTIQGFADFAAVALNKARLYEENLRLDTVDHETDLLKYPAFLEKLHEALVRGESSGEHFSLMLLDVDNYKHIALTYGYENARLMLREIAGIIRQALRPTDAAGRYGFDEFIVLRANTEVEAALREAEALCTRIREGSYARNDIRTSVSIGVSVFPVHAAAERELLHATKESLYEAQRSGRDRVVSPGPSVHPR